MGESGNERTRARRRVLPGALTVVIGVVVSGWVAGVARDREEMSARLAVERFAEERVRALQQELSSALEVVRSIGAFYDSSSFVSRDEFERFTRPFLRAHAKVQALEWIPRVRSEERADWEARARAEGLVDFSFRELTKGELAVAGPRPEYFPVYYVAPLVGNERALGFDLSSDSVRRAALERACDEDAIIATGRIALVQEQGSSCGILVFMPVFAAPLPVDTVEERRSALTGLALGVFRLQSMVTSTLLHGEEISSSAAVVLRDLSAKSGDATLFERGDVDTAAGDWPVDCEFEFGGRRWSLRYDPQPGVWQNAGFWRFYAILAAGLALSLLLGAYVNDLIGRHDVVERLVEQRTAELSETQQDLEEGTGALIGLNQELVEVNSELRHRNEELDEFAHIASHDLQEPLRKLTSFSEILAQDLGTDLSESVSQDLHFITDAAQRMRVLVHDLLDLSRATRQPTTCETLSLDGCVDEALAALDASITAAGATVEREPLGQIVGDSRLVTQVYQNIIGNALKFCSPETPLIVRLGGEERDGYARLFVADNGIGIESSYREQIFAPFKRLHGRGEFDGSGIGLAICKKNVVRLGGEMWVESTPGEGSVFWFTLPLRRELVTPGE